MTTPPADGMPTTRGTNFYLADPNLAFVCATVMGPADLERAPPHLTAARRAGRRGRPQPAGPPDARRDGAARGRELAASLYLRKWLRPPAAPASVFTARESGWLTALVDWTPVPADALAEPAGGG